MTGCTTTPRRLIAVGASNLTRALPALERRGGFTEVFTACGYGRSYGAPSWFFLRRRRGIDGCGLWSALEKVERAPALGLVTDVGNDILYGFDVEWILQRIRACLDRLRPLCDDLVVTGLPLDSIATVGRGRWVLLRTLLVPGCRVGLAEAKRRAAELHEGLRELAGARRARFEDLPGSWYGTDPIHVRARSFDDYCATVLGRPADAAPPGATPSGATPSGAAPSGAAPSGTGSSLAAIPPPARHSF